MEYRKITILLDKTSDNVSRFIIKNWIEAYDPSGNGDSRYKPNKQIKNPCCNQDYVITIMHILLLKELLMLLIHHFTKNRISQVQKYHGKLKTTSKYPLSIKFLPKERPYFLSPRSSKQ